MYKVKIKKLKESAMIPARNYDGDAGFDLFSIKEYVINAGDRCLIQTGISIELPPNTEAQVRPRSGLALKNGITVLNSPGTIDEQYRGEIGVILINHGKEVFTVKESMRIAQLIIKPVLDVEFVEVERLSDTKRNKQGFGSSGIKEKL